MDIIRSNVRDGNVNVAWMERLLRDAALHDAARILEGFLNNEVPQIISEPKLKSGEKFHSFKTRKVHTCLGVINLRRAYYRGHNGGRFPMDEVLGLHNQYTPATINLMCWAGALDSSFDLASETLKRLAGLEIPGRQIQRVINAFGQNAANWMYNRQSAPPKNPIDVLTIQTDMTGIPMRPEELQGIKGKQPDGTAKTRQIKVGCVFTQSRDAKGQPQRTPYSNTYVAAFRDRTEFAHLLWTEALKRGYTTARKVVFIGDGAEWIWNMANDRFREAVQIVDFYHACEHLNNLCSALEPNDKSAKTLFEKWRKSLENNGLPNIIQTSSELLPSLSNESYKVVKSEIAYFQKHAHRMTYRTFKRKGYFIGSGAIEGACRHIVAQRTKLSGMRWSCNGSENVIAFRCLIKSNLFDEYCNSKKMAA